MSNTGWGRRLFSILALGALSAAAGAACSATGNNQFTGSGGAGAGSGTGGASTSGGGDIGFGAGNQGGSTSAGAGGSEACAAEPHVAMQVPLDMYIMLDQSSSMTDGVSGGGDKWGAVTGALKSFVQQPGISDIGVGIQYFGLSADACQPFCTVDADCGGPTCGPCFFGFCIGPGASDSCDPSVYAQPEVEIAPLAQTQIDKLVVSINKHQATTGTPTSAALQGAIDHSKTWASSHPGHVVVAVFATDGQPSGCDEDINHINAIAAAGANGSPKVLTFVIGVGTSVSNLNSIAANGGTGQAFIVDTNQNTNDQFLMALNAIRGAALGCTYDIPQPTQGTPDYGKVNVQYTPGGGGPVEVFDHYQDKAHCPASGNGWYYDDNTNPTQINLCDDTCNLVGADLTGKIDILLGCKTKEPA